MPRTKKYCLELSEAEFNMLARLVSNGWGDGSYGVGRLSASEHKTAYRLMEKVYKLGKVVRHDREDQRSQ